MGIFNLAARDGDRAPASMMTERRRQDRTIDELIGICRGIICDGGIVAQEADFLQGWLQRNAECSHSFAFETLLNRLHDALRDGVVDGDEERDLLFAHSRFVGGEASGEADSESASLAAALPLDEPPPSPLVMASVFVVTGTFEFGSRAAVIDAITEGGGTVNTTISRKVRYLLVGTIGSRDWIHSSYGRKIEKAAQLRSEGTSLSIVAEAYWRSCCADR